MQFLSAEITHLRNFHGGLAAPSQVGQPGATSAPNNQAVDGYVGSPFDPSSQLDRLYHEITGVPENVAASRTERADTDAVATPAAAASSPRADGLHLGAVAQAAARVARAPVQAAGDVAVSQVEAVGDAGSAVGHAGMDVASGVGHGVAAAGRGVWDALGDTVGGDGQAAVDLLSGHPVAAAQDAVNGAANSVGDVVGGTVQAGVDGVSGAASAVGDVAGGAVNVAGDVVGGAATAAGTVLSSLPHFGL